VAQRELYQPENSANEQLLLTSIEQDNYDLVTDCTKIEQLAKTGCVGVVIYYVGERVPSLPAEIKETA
jgi:hypothetical protein